jgi:hypothetical protein
VGSLIPHERIVYTYRAVVNRVLRWAALVTIDLTATESGTRLEWTEQYSFITLTTPDGSDAERHLVGGTRLRLNALAIAAHELV